MDSPVPPPELPDVTPSLSSLGTSPDQAASGIQQPVLSAEFLARLHGIRLASRKVFSGHHKGERRSRHRGSSVEFADFRDYTPGDDPRFVDWNIFGRHGRLSIKLFHEEEDLPVSFFVDISGSMGFGEPKTKLQLAREMTAALGYVGVSGLDRVSLGAMAEEGQQPDLPARRGRQAYHQLQSWLARLEAQGPTNLPVSLRRHAMKMSHAGLVVVLSDFLDPAGFERAVLPLLERGCEIHMLHILSPEELQPSLTGDLRLLDSETQEVLEVTVTPNLLARYQNRLGAWLNHLEDYARRRGIHYQLLRTDGDPLAMVLKTLRRAGLVK